MPFVGLLTEYVRCIPYVGRNHKRQAFCERRDEKDVGGSGSVLLEDILSAFAATELNFQQ
jgi:hypothetical protein